MESPILARIGSSLGAVVRSEFPVLHDGKYGPELGRPAHLGNPHFVTLVCRGMTYANMQHA
jgi:hypothetical protein